MLPPCPDCNGTLHEETWDLGRCPNTGYFDEGERFECLRCGAAFDTEDLDRAHVLAEASLMSRDAAKPIRCRSEVIQTMATQNNRAPREIVDFPANVPVTVALKYAQGKTVSNQYGERIMYSLADGRVMFLDLAVAGQIESLGVNVCESFTITRKWNGEQGSNSSWEVARIAGEQPNGTFVVPVASPKPVTSATTISGSQRQVSRSLTEEAQSLVDVYAAVWEYTRETYRGQVKPEEVRAFVTTAYIQRGRSAAA